MAIAPDHTIVSARDPQAAARRLGELLGVPWSASGIGPFSPVYVSDGFTVDFVADPGPFPIEHIAFRVDDATFDAILGRLRAAGVPFRSQVHGPMDMAIDTAYGGRIVYWNEPEGHYWEILTRSYARQPRAGR